MIFAICFCHKPAETIRNNHAINVREDDNHRRHGEDGAAQTQTQTKTI